MLFRILTGTLAFAAALSMTAVRAPAAEAKYPNWKGQWDTVQPRFGGQSVKFDPTKAFGPAQQAPLTDEYKKVHEESMADQALGGQGNFIDHARCIPGGMPSMMAVPTMEFIVTPETTYIAAAGGLPRIFTAGGPWAQESRPTYPGFAIWPLVRIRSARDFHTLY